LDNKNRVFSSLSFDSIPPRQFHTAIFSDLGNCLGNKGMSTVRSKGVKRSDGLSAIAEFKFNRGEINGGEV
jgi:hypothetical protein